MRITSKPPARALCAVVLLLVLALTSGCARTQTPTLNVSAASSLRSVLVDIAPTFEKANHVKLVVNYGASGVLMKQIEAGSPTDLFLSAGAAQVETLTAEGLVSAEATATFAGNDLVILVPTGNPADILGPNDLAKATRLATGDPAVAPHGTKAREWLTGLGMWDTLRPKFAFAANASQTDDYVARGEVDAGIGFASDAAGRRDIDIAYVIPSSEYSPVRYVAAPIEGSPRSDLARAFVAYLLERDVQRTLVDAGFKPASIK